MLGKKPVTNGGSGARRSCAAESVLVSKPSHDSWFSTLREYSIAW